MTKIMIDKMGQFPNNITVDEPIPGKAGFDDPIFFKNSYAKSDSGNREKPRQEPVENKNQKRYSVFFDFESFVQKRSHDLDKQKKRHDG
jgi:hypothetical protein